MSLHLVTGHAGYEHITPADHGAFHNALLLSGSSVLNSGNNFSATVVTNNSIKISDGELIMQGRHVRLKPGDNEEVTIENGTQDYKRNDLIVARYVKDGTTGVEGVSFVVIKGTPGTTATDPAYIEGNILNGVLTADFPLYRVPLNGLNVGELVPLFEVKDSFDKRISDIISGAQIVGKAGNADKLGGNKADYFATQEGLNAVQTTSRATLSTPGWYRVAEYVGQNEQHVSGNYANGCKLTLKRQNVGNGNEELNIILNSVYDKQRFSVSSSLNKTHSITKIRYVYEGITAYIEIYYTGTESCSVTCDLNNPQDRWFKWNAIDFVATSETVDGVTVTTTYDIPANASPVTDLDLQRFSGKYAEGSLSTSILEKALTVEQGYHNFILAGSGYTGNDLPHDDYKRSCATVFVRNSDGIAVLLWFRHTANAKRFAMNYYNGTSWSGWDTTATTADLATELAKYFPLTGGTVEGSIVSKVAEGKSVQQVVDNTVRRICSELYVSGQYHLYDSTNSKEIITSTPNGTNTFNGTASGNLPLDGGGTVNGANVNPFIINSTSSDDMVRIPFQKSGVTRGFFGFVGTKPAFTDANYNYYELHHDGNSAKVHIGADTPGDTNTAWFDTSDL